MAEAPLPAITLPTTYRERLAQFKILEEKRIELIEVCWTGDSAGFTNDRD